MKKHYNITVKGKVQGVWYRKSTQDKARELGLMGFIKNLPNGDVYIEVEGNGDQLKFLLDWCAIGPQFARVTQVLYDEATVQSFTQFEIIR